MSKNDVDAVKQTIEQCCKVTVTKVG